MYLYVSDHVDEYADDEIGRSDDTTQHDNVRFVAQQMH